MSIFKRILGICDTRQPADPTCWAYAGGALNIDLTRAAELAQTGGAIRLEGGGLPKRVLIYHAGDDVYKAFINKCSHMGRRIDPLPGTEKLQCCSVSKTTYDKSGNVLSGPGKGPLTSLTVEKKGSSLKIRI